MIRGFRFLLFAVLSVAAGCTANPEKKSPDERPPLARPAAPVRDSASTQIKPEYRELADLYYHVLVGEFAGHRRALGVAVENYVEAARRARDPAVAKRATRIAVFAQDYPRARTAAERWVSLSPDSLDARRTLGVLYLRTDRLDEAVTQFDETVTLAEQSGERGFYLVARLLARESDKDRALKAMAELASRHSEVPEAHYAAARLAADAERPDQALGHVERALALKPGWGQAVLLRARVLMDEGKPDQAVTGMAGAVKQSPDDEQLRLNYARLLAEAGRYQEARAQFERLLDNHPEDPELLYAIAMLSTENEQYDMAVGYFQRLIKTGRRVDQAHYYLGLIAETRERYPEAIEWYSKVSGGKRMLDARIRVATLMAKQGDVEGAREYLHDVAAPNETGEVRLILAESDILRRQERYQDALSVVNQALAESPSNNDLLYARAMIAVQLDQLDVVERDLKQIIARDPDNAHALNALGYTLADQTDRYQEALEYIQKALKLSPDSAAILDSMGWIQYRLGNLERALTFLRRAYDKDPDPEIAAHLGEVLWMSGDKDGARAIWKRALEKEPDAKLVRETMERLGQ